MASKSKIGTTWWSRRWLEAFEAIDYYKRLARGKTYFNQNRIVEMNFHDGMVEAMVDGSAYFPYVGKIRFRPFPKKKVQALVEAISAEPRLLSALLQGELPPEVCDIAERAGLELFPKDWSELRMECSCPDMAVPCKHLAAVFFKTVEAIDTDPFWIFKFRGVDLVEELKAYGVNLDLAEDKSYWTLEEIASRPVLEGVEPFKEPITSLPLYLLYSLEETVPTLFDAKYEEAPFTMDALKALYRQSAKQAAVWSFGLDDFGKEGEEEADASSVYVEGGSWSQFLQESAHLKAGLPYAEIDGEGVQLGIFSRTGTQYPVEFTGDIVRGLAALTKEELKNESAVLTTWAQMAQIALYLVERGAYVPMVYRNSKRSENHGILWLPAIMSDVVARIVASVQQHLVETVPEWEKAYAKRKPEHVFLNAAQHPSMALMILSGMITGLLQLMTLVGTKSLTALTPLTLTGKTPFVASGLFNKLCNFVAPLSLQNYAGREQAVLMVRSGKEQSVSLNLGVRTRGEEEAKPTPYKTILSDARYEAQRYQVISLMERLTRAYPDLEPIIESGGKATTLLKEHLTGFLFEAVPALSFLGVQVMLPKRLANLLKPTLNADVKSSTGQVSLLDKDAVFSFDWKIAIGDKTLTEEEFRALEAHAGEVIPWTADEFVYLDPEMMAKIRARLEEPQEVGRIEVLGAVQTGMADGVKFSVTEELSRAVEELQRVKEVPLPKGLQATLRPYQERGYAWLYKNEQLGVGSLIADDMGLGKTLQVITLLLKLKEEGKARLPHLVVVPTSLLSNWCREIEKFVPSLTVNLYHGGNRMLDREADIVLTTYGTARVDIGVLSSHQWHLLIIDEAQAAKASSSLIARALRRVKAQGTIAMTGTPVENRLSEMWSIFELVEPGLLGHWDAFSENYAQPIAREHNPQVADRLKQLISPFMLRRLKTDKSIISDLPDKMMIDHFVSLGKHQAALYQHTLDEMMKVMMKAREAGDQGRARMLVLALMTKLKQICNSPAQFTGQTSGVLSPDSGKGQALLEILDAARANGQKVLIFTQYVTMGELLQKWIEVHTGRTPDFLQGKIPVKKRMEMVDRFQNDPEVESMIISLKAGGTGLNLVAATVVVHYDLWWNPAVENQATDRAYRIGQKNKVQVYRLITSGTFEESINEVMTKKRELAELTVTTGEQWLGDLPSDELEALLKLH